MALGGVALGATSARSVVLAGQTRPSQSSAPLLWWVANGMTETQSPGNPPRYGGFNAAMGLAIAGMTPAQATQWSQEWIRTQWVERGPSGTAEFYAAKAAWNWGDGMFWAWGEGQDARPDRLPTGSGFVGAVRAVDRPDGRWYQPRSDLTQAAWLALLVVAGLGAVLTPRPRPEVVLLALSVLGLAVFTLLFQGRSRYLFTFVPVVVSLAAMVHPAVSGWRARGDRAWRRRFSRSSRGGPAPG